MNRPPGSTGPISSGSGLVDILNQLDSSKRNEMLALVGQYKGRGLLLNDFMVRARELLGERLYGQLARDMSNAAAARGAGIPPVSNTGITGMTGMTGMPGMSGIMPTPGIPHQMRPPMSASQMPMHSMPLIYGNQSNTGNYQYQIQQSTTTATLEVDVTKMDTSSLQDVMQYSGVDLKAEAELLYRENDAMSMGSGAASVEHRLKFDYFFNPFKFRAIVQHALQRHFFSNTPNTTDPVTSGNNTGNNTVKVPKPLGMTEEAVHLLGIAIQKRLIGILRRLSEISRHRVDYGRGRFKIKIENDPKKQIWLQEKLFIEGIGEEKRRANAMSSSTTTSTSNPTTATATATPTVNQTLLNPPSLATINAAAATAAANKPPASSSHSKSGASSSSANANGSDDTVKTKLANSTALAALGVRQKSWMSAASVGGPSHSNSASTSNQPQNSDQDDKEPAEVFQQHPLASFYSLPSSTPLTDAELRAQYFNRTIAIVDLITCMETDPHMKRSRLLAVLYEALPRENKENNKETAGKDNASE